MKLWQKISLICVAVLLIMVGLCSTVLLKASSETIIQLTLDSELIKQRNLAFSFKEMASYYRQDNASSVVELSLITYCFSRFADASSVLVHEDKTIKSATHIKPEQILPLDGFRQEHFLGEYGDRSILIVGSRVDISNKEYLVYTVKDITSVYQSIIKMIWEFVTISLICTILGALIVMLLVIFTMRPLRRLSCTVRRIAEGEYNERVLVTSGDEVGNLAADFNIMADAIENHIRELRQKAEQQLLFIGGLAHEFKTPMTSMIMHSETLLYTKQSKEETLNSLSHIYEQCRWLERLMRKMLELITIDQSIETTDVYVPELLEDVEMGLSEVFKQRNITLKTQCETEYLSMDRDLMCSLLINLADNASKASEPGQEVIISVHEDVIEVIDSGRGISDEELIHITEPFYMVDKSRSKKQGGSGLGLALADRIAEAHGTKLEFSSEPSKGTRVKIHLHKLQKDNNL